MLPHAQSAGASEPLTPAPALAPGTQADDAALQPDSGAPDGEQHDPGFSSELRQRARPRVAATELVRDTVPMPLEAEAATETETASEAAMVAAETWPTAESQAPSFVADVQRRTVWRSRPVRAVLWLAVLLLLAGLVLQMTLGQRDWLAARLPRLTPVLQALCAQAGCSVQPYRQLEAVVIDGSAFNRVRGSSFRFSITLRNTSDWPVASPALELTLTDAQEQTLARRVLTAAELGAPSALPARGEFGHTYALTLGDAASPNAIAGYRVTAFYP
jgi:hypothetical protein